MMQSTNVAVVALLDFMKHPVATITIEARSTGSLFVLPDDEAKNTNEQPVQLVEGFTYEFEVNGLPDGWRLRESAVVQPSKRHPSIGRIEPGLAVGLLPLIAEDHGGVVVARAAVEVRSSKLSYLHDYRMMLNDLATTVLGLLTDIRAHSMTRLKSADSEQATIAHHQFAFVRAALDSNSFHDAISRVLAQPHRQLVARQDEISTSHLRRPNRATLRAFASHSPRVPISQTHPLYASMRTASITEPSVPRVVPYGRATDTVDTAENQFVKFALAEFEGFLASMEQRLSAVDGIADARLRHEVARLRERLSQILSAGMFRIVSEPRHLPLGSPVLQRKGGYREVLLTWLRFHLAANLHWDGGEDVFEAGKRDVALLYEYWVFFQLLKTLTRLLQIDEPPARQLVEWTRGHFDLKLKSGTMLSFEGLVRGTSRPMRARFSYNRTFPGTAPGSSSFPHAGSWTRTMRPDFTVSLWPAEFTANEAELNEQIVHIHFDAKYRVDRITDIFGSDDPSAVEADDQADRNNTRAKRADLLKMHAYRDAIRRTEGAYVIYPGITGSQVWRGFHEILPGLGAFALRPDSDDGEVNAIATFLRDVVLHVADPDTDRERLRRASAEIHLQ